ncbi:MAG: hypothetical protein ACLVH9_08400 [Fusobacterium sp.]|jgi:hypothetical protein|uniref:hypothetical protein n=1 Tax=Fusobacterium sp. TaxID=68766 RepID=UPI003999C211
MRKLLGILMIFIGINIIGVDEAPIMPMIPLLPAIPNKPEVEGETQKRPLETKTIIMGMEVEVIIPLEIISDIEIQAMIIDDQEVEVPFEIEMNKEPDKKDFYKLNFTENEIDIDDDGQDDTYIYSSKFINSKIEKDNKVVIKGKNISKEGYHQKIIYITVETHD